LDLGVGVAAGRAIVWVATVDLQVVGRVSLGGLRAQVGGLVRARTCSLLRICAIPAAGWSCPAMTAPTVPPKIVSKSDPEPEYHACGS